MVKITEKQIDRAISMNDPESLPVCCIIKSTVTNLVDGTKMTQWQVVTEPKEQGCLEIDRKRANAIITLLGMQPAVQIDNDILYDTSDTAYRRKYRFHTISC